MRQLPLIEDLTDGPIPQGSNLLVEFDAGSNWHNASITIAAGCLRNGNPVAYNVAAQPPENIRARLKLLGLNPDDLEREEKLEIWDWYTSSLGQSSSEKSIPSLKMTELSIEASAIVRKGAISTVENPIPTSDWIRIVDDYTTLARFNDEKAFVEYTLSREFPKAPKTGSMGIYGLLKGVLSDCVYRRIEASADGVIEFRLDESGDEALDLIRLRNMRNITFNRRWHRLKIDRKFEVTLEK